MTEVVWLLWGIASSPRKTGIQLEFPPRGSRQVQKPGPGCWAPGGCVTVCAEHCHFSGSEAPWLEVKGYEYFPKHRSTTVSGPAHKTAH